jgi:hypothetical protein
MKDPIPNLSSYKPQRRWLPTPPGGWQPDKPRPDQKPGKKPGRQTGMVRRHASGLSQAGVIIMGVALAAVVVVVLVIALTRV